MTEKPITTTTTVREAMVRYPQTETVFNRHGLTGCGGPRGPLEPIGFFATVHQVDPDILLHELNEAAIDGSGEPATTQATAEEADIYRPFVKTALGIVVTVGCSLGAINLAAMAMAGVTDSFWEAITQAHGHAQIFGWVGLFIMGVAYHVLPRLKSTQLQGRPLALASYWLMLAGIALRMVAQPLAESPSFAGILVLASLSELVAASLFLYVMVRTLASNPAASAFYDKYVIASAGWLWVSAAATVALSLYLAGRGLAVIPTALDAPYLHVALMGFVAMMIFGITLRTIPVFMGLRNPNERVFDLLFWTLNLSVALKAGAGWGNAVTTLDLSPFATAGALLEYGSLLAFVYFLGIFRKPERNVAEEGASRGYERFVRASYLWLVVAATMTFTYALYQASTGQPVPHALVGAYRHALTVGFISMILIGMAARVIPVFTGVRLHSDLMLLGTFLLLNLGNAVRVITQPLAALLGGPVFVFMGISGFVEVMAMGLFAYNLWRTIDSPVEAEMPAAQGADGISPYTIVADLLARYPEALEVFVRHGFTQLLNPLGRRTLARAVTLEQAAQIKGIELEGLLRDLRQSCLVKAAPLSFSYAPAAELEAGAPGPASKGQAVSRELVMMALKGCYDPEIPVNIVDLGLVYGLRIAGHRVEVKLTLTAPGCPMGDQMVREVRESLAQLPAVEEVAVDLVFDPPWTPDRMTDAARRRLGWQTA